MTGAPAADGEGLVLIEQGVEELTAVAIDAGRFMADVSRETLSLTTLGALAPGSRVNLETALTLATPLGGHLVSGHVDGVGYVVSRSEDSRSVQFTLRAPDELARYIADHERKLGIPWA